MRKQRDPIEKLKKVILAAGAATEEDLKVAPDPHPLFTIVPFFWFRLLTNAFDKRSRLPRKMLKTRPNRPCLNW